MDIVSVLKPSPFVPRKVGDPEQLLTDFSDYKKTFAKFLRVTGLAGIHTADHADCTACTKAKDSLQLVGGKEMDFLFEHVGTVVDEDTYEEALGKIEAGIKSQTNQATARYKLFMKMPQVGTPFTEWFPKVKDQADRCIWEGYDAKQAARDAILFQTESSKLQKKIIAEELDYDNTVKYGLAFEQGEAKVQQMREQKIVAERTETEKIAQLEEQV